MKRKFKSLLAIALSVAVMVTFVPMMGGTVMAASKLKAPTLKVAEKTDKTVTLSWGKVKNAKSYVVYEVNDNDVKVVKKSKSLKATVKNLKADTKYTFKIRAAKKSDYTGLGSYSKAKSVTTKTAKAATLDSARKVSGALYEMNYSYDYDLDGFIDLQKDLVALAKQEGKSKDRIELIKKHLGISTETIAQEKAVETSSHAGCTAFSVNDNKGNNILGRNYDWNLGNAGVVLHTDSEDGYASVSLSDISLCGLSDTEIKKKDESVLMAPFYSVDGVNEKGLATGILIVDENGTIQKAEGKADILSTYMIRIMLDTCANVNEAVDLFKGINMFSAASTADYQAIWGPAVGEDLHWIVADKSGNRAIIEYVDNELCVNYDDSVLDIGKSEYNVVGYNDFYFKWMYDSLEEDDYWPVKDGVLKNADLSRSSQDFVLVTNFFISKTAKGESATRFTGEGVTRYKTVYEYLDNNKNVSKKDAMNLLKQCRYYKNDPDILLSYDQMHDDLVAMKKANEEFDKTAGSDAEKLGYRYTNNKYFWYVADEGGMADWTAQDYGYSKMTPAQYDKVLDSLIAYYADNDSDDLWQWQTLWSTVYDTANKTVDVCAFENYNEKFTFGIEY